MDKLNENKTTAPEKTVENADKTYVNKRYQLAHELVNFLANKGVSQWEWVDAKDDVDQLIGNQKIMPVAD